MATPLLSATAATTPSSGYRTTMRADLAPGVEHLALTKDDPAFVINVASMSPAAHAAVRVVSAGDLVGPRPSDELELPTAMCVRTGCLAAVNGDFFMPGTSEPLGAVVTGGRLLRSPAPGRSQLSIVRDGTLGVGPLTWSGAVVPEGGAPLRIDAVNTKPVPDGVTLYTPYYGARTPAGAHEVVIRHLDPPSRGAEMAIDVVRRATGDTVIPSDGAVLTGLGEGATAVREFWDRGADAERITLRLDTDAVESVGIHPVLVSGGRAVAHGLSGSFATGRHGRTMAGSTADGSVVLVTVDDSQNGSPGASLAEAAQILLDLGVVDGGNLDGGGGTTFVVDGRVVNRPTDGPGSPASRHDPANEYAPDRFERPSVNAVAVVPVAPPARNRSRR